MFHKVLVIILTFLTFLTFLIACNFALETESGTAIIFTNNSSINITVQYKDGEMNDQIRTGEFVLAPGDTKEIFVNGEVDNGMLYSFFSYTYTPEIDTITCQTDNTNITFIDTPICTETFTFVNNSEYDLTITNNSSLYSFDDFILKIDDTETLEFTAYGESIDLKFTYTNFIFVEYCVSEDTSLMTFTRRVYDLALTAEKYETLLDRLENKAITEHEVIEEELEVLYVSLFNYVADDNYSITTTHANTFHLTTINWSYNSYNIDVVAHIWFDAAGYIVRSWCSYEGEY